MDNKRTSKTFSQMSVIKMYGNMEENYLLSECLDVFVEWFWWTDVLLRIATLSRWTCRQFTLFKHQGQEWEQRMANPKEMNNMILIKWITDTYVCARKKGVVKQKDKNSTPGKEKSIHPLKMEMINQQGVAFSYRFKIDVVSLEIKLYNIKPSCQK